MTLGIVREAVECKFVKLQRIGTDRNIADMLTKALTRPKLQESSSALGLAFSPPLSSE